MDPSTLDRASEPFYTTKEPGVGMGLGLFLARSIVDRIGGTFQIRSEPGKGTIVTVRIPRVAGSDDEQGTGPGSYTSNR